MVFVKGHKMGRGMKGRSGRKSRREEVDKAVALIKKEITQEALVELANKIINKRLLEIDEVEDSGKKIILSEKFALPITLKAIKEKKETDHNIKLSDDELKNKLAERLAEILE